MVCASLSINIICRETGQAVSLAENLGSKCLASGVLLTLVCHDLVPEFLEYLYPSLACDSLTQVVKMQVC